MKNLFMCSLILAKLGTLRFRALSLSTLLLLGLLSVWAPTRVEAAPTFNINQINPFTAAAGSNIVRTFTVDNPPIDGVLFGSLGAFPPSSFPTNAIIGSNGQFSWTPNTNQAGINQINVWAIETGNPFNSNYTTVTIIVTNVVTPVNNPVLTPIADQTIDAGTLLQLSVSATNTDNTTNAIIFTLDTNPASTATITAGTNSTATNGVYQAIITWDPTFAEAQNSPFTFTVTATEQSNPQKAVSQDFTVSVNLVSDCPQYPSIVSALLLGNTNLILDDCSVVVVTNTLVVMGSDVTLTAGISNLTISANNLTRLFTVMSGASLTLQGLTLQSGRSTSGGAIYIHPGGTVTLENCIIQNNTVVGVDGLNGTTGSDDVNYGGSGGNSLPGWPGLGGAICNLGTLIASGCQFSTNVAFGGNGGAGGNGGSGNYQGGAGGQGANGALAYGGAIYNYGKITLTSNCVFIGNAAVAGNGGVGGTAGGGVFNAYDGNGGSGSIAAGGAICTGPQVDILDCSFLNNVAQGGTSAAGGTAGGGYGVDGAPGGAGFGGAICMIGGSGVGLSGCLFLTNYAIGGNGGNGGDGFYGGGNGGNGGDGAGGCLYNIGRVTTANCTFTGCFAYGGTNGVAGSGPFAGRSGLPGNSLRGRLTNIVNGLTVANPSLMGGGASGSYLPLIDPGSTVNPYNTYGSAAAASSPTLAQLDVPPVGAATLPPNAVPKNQVKPADTNAPGVAVPPTALPDGSIIGPDGQPVPGGPMGPLDAGTNLPSAAHTPGAKGHTEEMLPEGMIDFRNADLNNVLDIYAMLVNRTILKPSSLPAPAIFLKTQGRLTVREGIQALDAVLALNGITMVNVGKKFVKAVPEAQSGTVGGAFSTNGAASLPAMGQYITEVVQVTNLHPSELMQALQPFVKIPNGILPVDTSGIIVLRDYAENVKRMLELIAKLDVALPSEFSQEVIPIKYAKATEIASALNALSSGGGGGSSVGGSTGSRTANSRTGSRVGGATGYPSAGAANPAAPPVAPGAQAAGSFNQRLQNIINRASGPTGDIQVLGQTKIIADERTNSLLVFATKEDMKKIKDVISKLDVVLAQVLIEAVIIEVTLTDSHDLGFSYLQHPQNIGNWTGVGAVNNKTFQQPSSYILGGTTNAGGVIPGGFSYLMSFGGDLDVAVAATEGNSKARILQRPRIQTSHNEPASIFVGQSRPYPTSSYYGGGAYGGYSSIQQLEIGVSLDVTPLINPDGLVVMDIHQKIDSFEGNVTIDNVGDVPITSEKEAQAKVSVRDHDTIILGGLIETDKNKNKSGVPFLMNLPILGYMFRSSHMDEKRTELIVLIRPTVLPTPEIAALTATAEKNKMPAVRGTEKELRDEESQRLKKANAQDAADQVPRMAPQ